MPLHLKFIVQDATVLWHLHTVGNYFIAAVYNSLYSSVSKETLAFLKQMLGIKVSVELRNGMKQDAIDCLQLPHMYLSLENSIQQSMVMCNHLLLHQISL